MVPSQYHAIMDQVPRDGVIFEWGSGGSTAFWLENCPVREVYSIEHDEQWFHKVRPTVAPYGNRCHLIHIPILGHEKSDKSKESPLHAAEYAIGSFLPLDTADVIIVDGCCRNLCMATAASVAKKGATLFLHDSQDVGHYGYGIRLLDRHPDWMAGDTVKPLPEESDSFMELRSWFRVN